MTPVYNPSVVVGKNVLNELERLMEDVNGAMRIAMGNLPDFQDDSFADRLNEEACNGDKRALPLKTDEIADEATERFTTEDIFSNPVFSRKKNRSG
ncbi:hypothetical protein ACFX13_020282 [Malus domestica]